MRRLTWTAIVVMALSLTVPGAMADRPAMTPPGLVCYAPGHFENGWAFTPGREHNLRICLDAGGHPSGPAR